MDMTEVQPDFNRSLETQHWSHFWTPEMKSSIIAPEIIEFPFLVIAMRAMYQGIEIDHPVFALLFYNLSFALICSVVNIVTLVILPMETWLRLACIVNGFFLQFHVICWSIISTLRSVYTLYLFIICNTAPILFQLCPRICMVPMIILIWKSHMYCLHS